MRCLFVSTTILWLILASTHPAEATSFTYTADALPWDDGWQTGQGHAYAAIKEDGGRSVLHIKDDSEEGGSHKGAYKMWDMVPYNWYSYATFTVKVASCVKALGIYIGIEVSDGMGHDYFAFYTLYPDRIEPFNNPAPAYSFDKMSGYNTYGITIHSGTARLTINGDIVMSHPATPQLYHWECVMFGAGSSVATGEAYFDHVAANQSPTDPIPEPSTILLLTTGLGGMVAYGYRRRKKT